MGEKIELYYLKMDQFFIYIQDNVNPHRIKNGLKPIEKSEANACYRILKDFEAKWKKEKCEHGIKDGDERECPDCGYTERDKRIHGDHHLCKSSSTQGEVVRDLISRIKELEGLIGEFGDNATDVFEQMEKGSWTDDKGHAVQLNDAMLRLRETVKKALE